MGDRGSFGFVLGELLFLDGVATPGVVTRGGPLGGAVYVSQAPETATFLAGVPTIPREPTTVVACVGCELHLLGRAARGVEYGPLGRLRLCFGRVVLAYRRVDLAPYSSDREGFQWILREGDPCF